MKTIKVKESAEIPNYFTGIVIYPNGTKEWIKEGKIHREDGPAIEFLNGYKEWWNNGLLHREDGPAIEYSGGSKSWYLEGNHYLRINLNDFVVLDSYQGKYGLMWYKLLDKDKITDHPDIPGLIMDFIVINTNSYYFLLHSKYKTEVNTDQGPFINDKKNHNIRKNKCMV